MKRLMLFSKRINGGIMNKSRPKDQAAYRARSNKRQYNRMVTDKERKALDKLLAELRK
jgi:hypothetical protein